MSLARQQAATSQEPAPAQAVAAPVSAGRGNSFLAALIPGRTAAGGGPAQGARTPTGFSSRARALFGRIDRDRDGHLSAEEIDRAMVDPTLTADDAAVVAALKAMREDLEELSNDEIGDENDGVTLADLEQYERKGQVDQGVTDRTEAQAGYGKGKIQGSNRSVFGGGAPDPTSVQQGSIGDCYFLAALVGKAYRDPAAVKRMIADNGNGTFTVTFPGRRPISVKAPTDAELARYSTSGQNGIWLAILEKAYGQVRNDESWFGRTTVEHDAADGGGFLSTGIGAVTGNGTDSDMLSLTSLDTTRAKLVAAMKAGAVVTAGTSKALPWQEDIQGGLVTGHAYTVVAYDRGADRITLRNPWGRTEPMREGRAADGKDDGVFTMTLAAFDAAFSQISYESR